MRSPDFDRKTVSISLKTDENLGQVRLLMFLVSKKAPPPPFANSWLRACEPMYSILLVATLECDATFIYLPLRLRRHFNVSNQRKGERPPLQRPFVLEGRNQIRLTSSVEQPGSFIKQCIRFT